jgi:hypothetical protein
MAAPTPPPSQDPAHPRHDAGTLEQGIAGGAELPSPRSVEDRIRFAKESLPGQRAALRPGTLRGLPPGPQGDENREPPANAPAPLPDAEQLAPERATVQEAPADRPRPGIPPLPLSPGGPEADALAGRRVSVGAHARGVEQSPAGHDLSDRLP